MLAFLVGSFALGTAENPRDVSFDDGWL